MNQIADTTHPSAPQTGAKAFPTPGTHLAKILFDAQYRMTFHSQLKRFNPFVVALYRIGLLPLFGMSRTVMLLTTQGRKSGRLRSTPIGYFMIGGGLYLFSAWGKNTGWYKNLTAHPEAVWVQVGMRKQPARAQVLQDATEIQRLLEQLVAESPEQARILFGWEAGSDRLETADFSTLINQVLIVRFITKRDAPSSP